jgi:hypothetical protein
MLNALAMKLELKPTYVPLNVAPSKDYQQQNFRKFDSFTGNQYQPSYRHPNFYNNTNYTSFTSNDYKPFVYQPASFASNNHFMSMPNKDCRPAWNNRDSGFNKTPRPGFYNFGNNPRQGYSSWQKCTVKLKFAGQEFEGEGATVQAARHNAAAKALEHFSQIENFNKAKQMAEAAKAKEATSSENNNKTVIPSNETDNKEDFSIGNIFFDN